MSIQEKLNSLLVQHLNNSDKVEFSSLVKVEKDNSAPEDAILAIIVHQVNSVTRESCLILLKESFISKILPIYSDLKVETAQSSELTNLDLLVSFSAQQDSMSVIFTEQENMSKMLEHINHHVSIAEPKQDEQSYNWVKIFTTTTSSSRKPVRSNTVPIIENTHSPLKYIMPIQRAETLSNITLKRTRTIDLPKSRHVSFESARDHYINAQLMKKEAEFVNWEKTTAFVGTWNVHGSFPNISLDDWLQGTLKTDDGNSVDPDFYVIGLQEIDTSASAYLRYDPTIENAWVDTILKSLKDNGKDYYKVESKQLVTILLVVIAKKKHQPYISDVSSTYAAIGILNMLGNKGGVAVRLRFHDSYICFVTSHLAAFTEQIEKRNRDFAELTKRLILPHRSDPLTNYVSYYWNDGGDEGVSFVEKQGVIKDWKNEASVFHSDFLIWCGDLNYRINLNESVVKNHIQAKELDTLLEYDQLLIERSAGRTFPMFEEGHIEFNPTYRYDAGTDTYDTSEKRRTPSWTDRVLWKKDRVNSHKQSIELLSYTNCMTMMLSDHKPVRALMNLNVRKIDEKLINNTQSKLLQGLKDHKDVQPCGQISTSFVEFKKVYFMETNEQNITLENTGQVVTSFKFLPKDGMPDILPPWLQVTPLSGTIAPGDKVVIRFEITIDSTVSAPLNRQTEKIDDILILRVENAKDFFISVIGDYVPTCFGVPLEELDDKKNEQDSSNQVYTVPSQIRKLVDFLQKDDILKIESLFLQHGILGIASYIRKCLDSNQDFNTKVLMGDQDSSDNKDITDSLAELYIDGDEVNKTTSANTIVDVLVGLLDSLSDTVIPTTMYEKALEASETVNSVNNFIKTLPPLHNIVLLYIIKFLRKAIDQCPDAIKVKRREAIVQLFTVLLHPPINFKERNPVVAEEKRKMFILHLLES